MHAREVAGSYGIDSFVLSIVVNLLPRLSNCLLWIFVTQKANCNRPKLRIGFFLENCAVRLAWTGGTCGVTVIEIPDLWANYIALLTLLPRRSSGPPIKRVEL
jgi:hypothetical protein